MKPDWILVANASEARLLQRQPGHPLALLQAFHHPESRRHSSELGDDASGRQAGDRLYGSAAFEPRLSPHKKEHLHFAQALAGVLEQGADAGTCERIHLFAASPFLGELKAALHEGARARLAGAHDLDLSALSAVQIEERLRPGEPS